MKRLLITITLFLLGIGCGFGAFFMLKTGTEIKQEELEKAEWLEFIRLNIPTMIKRRKNTVQAFSALYMKMTERKLRIKRK